MEPPTPWCDMTTTQDLGVPRPTPVTDLDWTPDMAARLGHDAVELWRDFLQELPDLPVQRGAAADDATTAMA